MAYDINEPQIGPCTMTESKIYQIIIFEWSL